MSKTEACIDEEGILGELMLGACALFSLETNINRAPPRKTAIIKIGRSWSFIYYGIISLF